jgi:hypothetical protein
MKKTIDYDQMFIEQHLAFRINEGDFDGVHIRIPIDKIKVSVDTKDALFDWYVFGNNHGVPIEKLHTEKFKEVLTIILNDMMEKILKQSQDNESSESQQTEEQSYDLLSDLFGQMATTK